MNKNLSSLQGRIVRLTIDLLYRRKLSANTLLKQGIWLANRRSIWRPTRGLSLKKFSIGSIPAELLETKDGRSDKIILHLHGGGYVVGHMDLYRFVAAKYARASKGANVLTIDYRVAPDHVYPAALEDVEKAWNWLLEQGYSEDNIIIAGDSAGGHLTVSFVMKLRDQGYRLPKAIITLSPWLDLTCSGSSYTTNLRRDPIFGIRDDDDDDNLIEANSILLSYFDGLNLSDPYTSPIFGHFDGFPNTLIQVGTEELIESDSLTFYQKLQEVGVNVHLTRYEGMFHDFQILATFLPESRQAWNEIETFIASQWP